jgi:hypothetical protein
MTDLLWQAMRRHQGEVPLPRDVAGRSTWLDEQFRAYAAMGHPEPVALELSYATLGRALRRDRRPW